jgi:hypothetical protein
MDSEISMAAMASSISSCIGQIQPLLPRLKTPELQHLGARLLRELDQIARMSSTTLGTMSYELSHEERIAADGIKLEAVQLLRRLRRAAGATTMLPLSLTYEHFISEQDASEPPHVQDAGSQLTVKDQIRRMNRGD